MNLSDFGKSISEMTETELNNQITKIRRERKTSGRKILEKKKKAVKHRESHKMKAEDYMAGLSLEQKVALADRLRKQMEEDK